MDSPNTRRISFPSDNASDEGGIFQGSAYLIVSPASLLSGLLPPLEPGSKTPEFLGQDPLQSGGREGLSSGPPKAPQGRVIPGTWSFFSTFLSCVFHFSAL